MEALALISQIVTQVDHEPVVCRLIRDVIRCAGEYVTAVNRLEAELLCSDLDGEALREQIQSLDKNRTMAHNALIDAINICNRHLRKLLGDAMPVGGIYPEPSHITSHNRRAIGDWAGNLVAEIFRQRR